MWGGAAGEEFAGAHTAGKSLEGCGFMKQNKIRGENEEKSYNSYNSILKLTSV